jgi:alpha-glucosidase
MLGLYREALRLRREHPALGDGALAWLESPDGTLVFSREPGFACTVNTGDEDAELPIPGTLLLASGPIRLPEGAAHEGTAHHATALQTALVLPPDTAAWWAIEH